MMLLNLFWSMFTRRIFLIRTFSALCFAAVALPAQAATTFYTGVTGFNADVVLQNDPTGMSTAVTEAQADALTTDGQAIKTGYYIYHS